MAQIPPYIVTSPENKGHKKIQINIIVEDDNKYIPLISRIDLININIYLYLKI
jgi:hypothetical protein